MAFSTAPSNHLFNACQLRPAESTRDNYAADLERALKEELSTSDSARQFFESTYPTSGIKDICRGIFSRLSRGDASNDPSVYRLGSGFGGGKTHTLIALAGAARHPELISAGETTVPADCLPAEPIRLATFTGENSDVERGALMPGSNSIRARSLIGQIAWQLGGEAAFDDLRSYDERLTSPGSEDIRRLLGEGPCLILVDELVQWLDRIQNSGLADRLGNVRTLFSSLIQAVETSPRTVLVITTPDQASDAYRTAAQHALEILGDVDSVFARISHQTIPSDAPDLPAILRRRLFTRIDEEARNAVSAAYAELCQRSSAHIAPPPQDRPVQQWFHEHYPLHPDTLRVIVERIASNDNFQNTRGILRLLGMTVHHMKNSGLGKEALLIHPHHIDPDNTEVHAELTTRINRGEFESAIVADIIGAESTAVRIDETRPTKPGSRLARAALLASLSPIATARGATPGELVRAVITPLDEDPSVVANAITEFRGSALYVNDDPSVTAIQFTTVPNLNRMLLERRNSLTASEINKRIKRAITDCFTMPRQRSQSHLQAAVFPSGSDIPDNKDSVGLGVINYEWFTQKDDVRLEALSNFYRNSPAGGGQSPREYKNNFVVLVANKDVAGDMDRHARRSLAACNVKDSPPDALQTHQLESLETELASADKDLFVAIQRLYVNLYYPSTDHVISSTTLLQHVSISLEVASERPGDGQHAVLHTLKSRRKLIDPESADLNPETYWKRRGNLIRGKVSLESLKEEFAREPSNYMLLNGGVADALLRKALDREVIVIQTGTGQTMTTGGEFLRTDLPEAMVYLRAQACPECLCHLEDCRCEGKLPHLCSSCGKEQHPGQCQILPPQPPISPMSPPFTSGIENRPLKVLAADMRRHMEQHSLTVADISSLSLFGDKADFIRFMGTVLGQGYRATVSYEVRRGDELTVRVRDMDLAEWAGVLARIAPALERLDNAKIMNAAVTILGEGNEPEQLERLLGQLPGNRDAGMEVTFRPRSEEEEIGG